MVELAPVANFAKTMSSSLGLPIAGSVDAVERDLFVDDELIQSIRHRRADLAAEAREDAEVFAIDQHLDRARVELVDLEDVVLRGVVEASVP
jgi:hypothetical protein